MIVATSFLFTNSPSSIDTIAGGNFGSQPSSHCRTIYGLRFGRDRVQKFRSVRRRQRYPFFTGSRSIKSCWDRGPLGGLLSWSIRLQFLLARSIARIRSWSDTKVWFKLLRLSPMLLISPASNGKTSTWCSTTMPPTSTRKSWLARASPLI
jgi:hypothetical protein